jgi:arginine decarboxylase
MQMPLVNALLQVSGSARESWHMPGHRGGQAWPAWFREALAAMDQTELPITDDINHPEGPAREAMNLAALAFGAGLSRMITSGSTVALQILLAACVGRRGCLLMPRSVHQAVYHAAALLDLDIRWLQTSGPVSGKPTGALPAYTAESTAGFSLITPVTAADVACALQANPDCRAVLLTHPDYYGGCLDLAAIAEVVHSHQALLLVDEAHGAHLAFGQGLLPAGALQSGADACVQSGHKTLPVLTPGAWLHLSAEAILANRVSVADVERMIPVFQTSSPSFAIAATMDYARAWLEQSGRQAIEVQLKALARLVNELPDGFQCPSSMTVGQAGARPQATSRDPLRLVIRCQDNKGFGRAARPAARWLAGRGIDIEFADLTRLILIPSLDQPIEYWRHLTDSLNEFARHGAAITAEPAGGVDESGFRKNPVKPNNPVNLEQLEHAWRCYLATPAEQAISMGEALFNRDRGLVRIPLAEAAGRVCSRAVMPYPPGIPLLVPGERIDAARVDFLLQLRENEISIGGIEQDQIWVLA